MKKKCIISGVVLMCLITSVNIMKSIQTSKNVTDIVLNHVESLASREFPESDDMRIATSQICYFQKDYYNDVSKRVETKTVEGRVGICDGDRGPCKSWNCTEVMQ